MICMIATCAIFNSRNFFKSLSCEIDVKEAIGQNVNLHQHEMLLRDALKICEKILTEGEQIVEAAVQQKPVANILPSSLVVTNKRVILHQPKIFKAVFTDFLWRDLKSVHLTDKFFGSESVFRFDAGYLFAKHLPKNQAKKVYSFAQAKEEEWVEKWRLRRIEEDRARSGANHIVVGNSNDSSSSGKMSIKERLLELDSLLQEGLITQDEYQNKKIEILDLI